MKKIIPILIAILICFGVGCTASYFQSEFQLLFNFTWSIFFFYLRSPLLGFANILVLDVLVVYYMIESYPVKKSSAYLFVPYLLWLILATYLNGYILMYN